MCNANATEENPSPLEQLYVRLTTLFESIEGQKSLPTEFITELVFLVQLADNIIEKEDLTPEQKVQLQTITDALCELAKKSIKWQSTNIQKTSPSSSVDNATITEPAEATNQPAVQEENNVLNEFLCTPSSEGFSSLCGMEAIVEEISAMFVLPLFHPELFQKTGSDYNLLLHGPPGCGKTQFVHALSIELGAKLYCLTPSNIMSKYVGDTEKLIEQVFENLRKTTEKTILFIDEIDAFCRARNESEPEYSRRIKIQLMHQLDTTSTASQLIVVAATNVPWDIDSAVMRRFQQQFFFDLPNTEQRYALLNFFLGKKHVEGEYNLYPEWMLLLNQSAGYSHSDLKQVVRRGVRQPIMELLKIRKWHLIDGMHYPCSPDQCSEENQDKTEPKEIHFCSVYDLPAGTVKSRPVEIQDLIVALRKIPRSVREDEMEKFVDFNSKRT